MQASHTGGGVGEGGGGGGRGGSGNTPGCLTPAKL